MPCTQVQEGVRTCPALYLPSQVVKVPLYSGTYRGKVWGGLARDRFHPSLLLVERPRSGALGPLTAIHSATSTASKRIPRSSTPGGSWQTWSPPPPVSPLAEIPRERYGGTYLCPTIHPVQWQTQLITSTSRLPSPSTSPTVFLNPVLPLNLVDLQPTTTILHRDPKRQPKNTFTTQQHYGILTSSSSRRPLQRGLTRSVIVPPPPQDTAGRFSPCATVSTLSNCELRTPRDRQKLPGPHQPPRLPRIDSSTAARPVERIRPAQCLPPSVHLFCRWTPTLSSWSTRPILRTSTISGAVRRPSTLLAPYRRPAQRY